MGNSSYDSNLSRYAAINSLILDTYGEKCMDISYDGMIKEMKQVSWGSSASEGGRFDKELIRTRMRAFRCIQVIVECSKS